MEEGGTCVREKIEKMVEIREEQYGFVAGKGILRQLQEKYLRNDKKLYLVFVDLVRHLTRCREC